MIQIDNTDFLYKTLQKLGVAEQEIDDKYLEFAKEGVSNMTDFNNYLLSNLEMIETDVSEDDLVSVADYYYDLKKVKKIPKNNFTNLLKQYKQTKDAKLREEIINSKLMDTLLIACEYKFSHPNLILDDIVQVSNLGLMEAVERYKDDARLSFEIYLNYWILDAINKEYTIGE
jgi:DNA-directed RNA polymerase sigma subunit (sigma70/sigma32)